MKYIVVMYGTTGEYRTDYSSKAKAEKAADNIRGLGYEAEVIKQTAQPASYTATGTQNTRIAHTGRKEQENDKV